MNRIPDLVTSDNGAIKFRSEHLKQEILNLSHAIEKIGEQRASSFAYLLGVDERRWKEKGAAWESWLEEYGVDLLEADVDEGLKLRIDTVVDRVKSTSLPKLDLVLLEGYKAWKDSGAPKDAFEEATVLVEDRVEGKQTVRPKTVI